VLTDVRMPDVDGLAVTRAIKRDHPTTSVLIVTMYENLHYLFDALKAGAAGYVLKDATRREVLTAVRQVLRGESPLSPGLVTQLLQRVANGTSQAEGRPPERLTPREREVLELVVRGQTNREIARGLGVGLGTVKVHIEHIIAKRPCARLNSGSSLPRAARARSLRLLG
jgi:DNA-binding NarL/FixJ family response regulator